MTKSTNYKEVFWSDISDSFPDMTMQEAFQTMTKKMVKAGLVEHKPDNIITAEQFNKYRFEFMKKRR